MSRIHVTLVVQDIDGKSGVNWTNFKGSIQKTLEDWVYDGDDVEVIVVEVN